MSGGNDVVADAGGVGEGARIVGDGGLDLLLELMEAGGVPETPPGSPAREDASGGNESVPGDGRGERVLEYCSDEERPKARQPVSMAAFKDVVAGAGAGAALATAKLRVVHSQAQVGGGYLERHSGLRIKDQLVSPADLAVKLSEMRFLRLQGIKSAMMRESIKGAWATIGIVAEKANPRLSSAGKNYVVWKLTSLDGTVISVFLFGEAYTHHWKHPVGSMVAIFNAKSRQENRDVCLSVFSRGHVMRIGTALDYGVCKGTRKDGTPCNVVLDRRQGENCAYHAAEALRKLKTNRAELRGGKISNPLAHRTKGAVQYVMGKPEEAEEPVKRHAKYLTSADLKEFLKNSDKVSSTGQSQGKRLLALISEMPDAKERVRAKKGKQQTAAEESRIPLAEKNTNFSKAAPIKAKNSPDVMELELDSMDNPGLHSLPFLLSAKIQQ